MGIQVVSEDLCSEKQWNVCKALATFVAHRELSKVDGSPSCPVIPAIPHPQWDDPTQVPSPPFPISSCTFKQEESSEHCVLNRSLYFLGLCPRYALLAYNGGRKVGTEGRDLWSAPPSNSPAAQTH